MAMAAIASPVAATRAEPRRAEGRPLLAALEAAERKAEHVGQDLHPQGLRAPPPITAARRDGRARLRQAGGRVGEGKGDALQHGLGEVGARRWTASGR